MILKPVVCLATLAAAQLIGCGTPSPDYLSSDLRARVEELQTAVATTPTTEESVFDRASTLREWADAYSLTGGQVPVNLTLDLTMIRFAEVDGNTEFMPPGIDWPWESILRAVDLYVAEMRLKDEEPEALGSFRLATPGPAMARQWTRLDLLYTVGSGGMAEGGSFLLGRQTMSDHGALQIEDPAGDNYVSVRASRPGVSFVPSTLPFSGMHGGFFSFRDMPVYRLSGGALEEGDTVTFTLGDRDAGSRGFQVQSIASDAMLLPFYVDLDGSGNLLTPRWASVEVVGTAELNRVAVFAPSVVTRGETFSVAVRSEDEYSNRTTAAIPAYELRIVGIEGELGEPYQLPAGNPAVSVVHDLSIPAPGIYRVHVQSGNGEIDSLSNPIWVEEDPERRVLWGETHGHTAFAEGQGSPHAYFRYGQEDARLDFLTLSEHDVWLDAYEWNTLRDLTRRTNAEGEMIAFLGYEWSAFRSRGGHHNVFFRRADAELVDLRQADRLPLLYERLREENAPGDVLIIPHAHRAGDWTTSDPELEKLVEIYSTHGSFEWFGNRYLQNGFEIGFVAASDDHRSKPGYNIGTSRSALSQRGGLAAAIAPSRTADAVFDALRSLSVYATSGQRILLDAKLNGEPMGTRLPSSARRELQARVSGTSPIDRIDVVKNGEVIFSRDYLSTPIRSHTAVLVTFESSSEVFGNTLDNPRPYRFWKGSVDIEGAVLDGIEPLGLDNPNVDVAGVDPEIPGRVHFVVDTRGRGETLLFRLDGASEDTVFSFHLDSTRESGFAPGIRLAQTLAAEDFRLRLGNMQDNRIEQTFTVGPHTDRIHLQLVDVAAPLDQAFEFTDLEDPEDGDYYYLRVTQLDGGRAWSSPFWVGPKARPEQEEPLLGALH